jgi:hypothetical protein
MVNFSNAGLIYANVRYNPAYVYDMDPTIGGTSVPGFTEWAGLYRFARLRSSRINVSFVNKEAFPVTMVICPNNFDPGANTSAYANYSSSRFASLQSTGPLTGNSACTMSGFQSTAHFAGVRPNHLLDSYCFPTAGGTPPNNAWFWYVGAQGSTLFTAAGVYARVTIDAEIDFFELTSPSA